MIRVLLVTTDRARSGAETVVAALARGLRARGHAVGLATLRSRVDARRDLGPALEDAGVTLFPLDRHGTAGIPIALTRTLDAFRPHLVHAHLDHAVALTRLLVRNVPLVTTLHSAPERRLRRLVLRALASRDALTVAVSESLAAHAREAGLGRDVRVVGNGVGEALLALGRTRLAADPGAAPVADPRIVALARLIPDKGLDLLLAAFARARRAVPGARLTIHGEGPERRRLERLAEELGLDRGDVLPGFAADPAEVLSGADLFALPSRREGFGLAALEAMAAGVPCVLGDLPAWRELARDAAILVRERTVESWAAALVELLRDPRRGRDLARRAHGIAARRSEDAMVAAHLALYDEVLRR